MTAKSWPRRCPALPSATPVAAFGWSRWRRNKGAVILDCALGGDRLFPQRAGRSF